MSVERAFIMAAGSGTRFWPAGMVLPKANLPLGPRLVIDRVVVDECRAAGITDFTIVLPDDEHQKVSLANAIRNAFEESPEEKRDVLVQKAKAGNEDAFRALNHIANLRRAVPNTRFITQPARDPQTGEKAPYGTAVPVQLCMQALAKEGIHLREGEQVAVLNADDLMYNPGGCDLADLIRTMDREGSELGIMAAPIPREEAGNYGLALPDGRILEHPAPFEVPDNPAINTGRYVLPRYVLTDLINEVMTDAPAANGEYQLTTAVSKYVEQGHPVTVHRAKGTFLNCGDPVNYARSNAIVCGVPLAPATS